MSARIGVVLFPGSNCEHDVVEGVSKLGAKGEILWHGDSSVGGVDAIVLPGGFAHGDYLRTGAIARFSPIMKAVADFAASGGPVLGICNGFQVLTEAGLLPGALQKNSGLKFICKTVELEVATTNSILTNQTTRGQKLNVPINHFEGNYTIDARGLDELKHNDQIIVRYVDNPNGSVDSIAGVCNEGRNVVGLMPHPERATDTLLGSVDGIPLLQSLISTASKVSA